MHAFYGAGNFGHEENAVAWPCKYVQEKLTGLCCGDAPRLIGNRRMGRAVNAFAVRGKPASDFAKIVHRLRREAPLTVRPHVEKQVPASRGSRGEELNDFPGRLEIAVGAHVPPRVIM